MCDTTYNIVVCPENYDRSSETFEQCEPADIRLLKIIVLDIFAYTYVSVGGHNKISNKNIVCFVVVPRAHTPER